MPPFGDANLTLAEFLDQLKASMRQPDPFMIDLKEAARRCGMSVPDYKKYENLKLLPPMNATGRVCPETLRRACLKLDGITESLGPVDQADAALAEFKRGRR